MASGIFGILLGVHPSMLKTKSRSPRGTSSAPAPAVAANKDASSSRQHLLAERESLYRYPASKTLHVTAARVGGEKLCRVEIKDDSDSEVLRQGETTILILAPCTIMFGGNGLKQWPVNRIRLSYCIR